MKLFNKNDKRININNFDVFNHGGCATIYVNEHDLLFKKYYSYTPEDCKIDKIIYDILSSIDNPHMIKIYNLYMMDNKPTVFKKSNGKTIDGYTAKFYKKTKSNILFAPIDYILDNFNELEKLFDLLAEYYIEVKDIRIENAVIGDDTITIIDPDLYRINKSNTFDNKCLNKEKLLSLFIEILFKYFFDNYDEILRSYSYKNLDEIKMYIIGENIRNIKIDEDINITQVLSKKLSQHKNLLDYLVNETKR